MRVLVCGGRDFRNWPRLDAALRDLLVDQPDQAIIQGGAKGADCLAAAWGFWKSVPVEEYAAEWEIYGKKAGGIRNQKMLDEGRPDVVLAFPGGKGTADMVKRAELAGIEVIKA